ncbi:MAG: polysaccharide deacetylase family protein [bacterium]|nr:polysaccharide deacetylase family protein [bacterium]
MNRNNSTLKWSTRLAGLVLSAAFVLALWGTPAPSGTSPIREIAVTFDDLPSSEMGGGSVNAALLKERTTRLLEQITRYKVPATGFVNAGKLFNGSTLNKELAGLLEMWLDAGFQLGNHTYAHKDINRVPWPEYKEDIVKGETVIKEMLEKRGMKPDYFRHPFLHAGNTPQLKEKLETFLAERGYKVAPVTVDNSEWIFARAYYNALNAGNKEQTKQVADTYISYMERKLNYYEQQSTALFGHEIRQVLLLHANALNAGHFGRLAQMMKKRGYRFISLHKALKDPAYRSPNSYAGRGGISWLHRWAITKGKKGDFFKGEPQAPRFVKKLAGIRTE